jgi:MFS family permease
MSRAGRWAGYAVGGALIGIGLVGLLADAERTDPLGWTLWFGGMVLLHDLVLVPLVLAAGAVLGRVREPYRAPLRAAAIVIACVTFVALPMVLGLGGSAAEPSRLPLAYGTNLAVIVAAIGLFAGAAVLWRRWAGPPRERRRPAHPADPGTGPRADARGQAVRDR